MARTLAVGYTLPGRDHKHIANEDVVWPGKPVRSEVVDYQREE
ncbi:MAG: hypothetical protein WHT09_12135 [Thermogutta sp.]|jgi:hypothetical protein